MLRRDGEVFFFGTAIGYSFSGIAQRLGVLAKNVVGSNPHRILAAVLRIRTAWSAAARERQTDRRPPRRYLPHRARRPAVGGIPAAPATIPAPPLRQYRLCRQSTARTRVRRHRYRFRRAILRGVRRAMRMFG